MKQRNPLVRLLSAIWSGVDGFRKILHLLLLLVVFAVFFGAMQGTTPALPDGVALLVQPVGAIVEELEGDPFDLALAEILDEVPPQTRLQDIIDALEYAKQDDGVEVVHLEVSGVGGVGLSKLQRIAAAIEDFKSSGKPVIASADFLSQGGYYLAAHADEVYLHPNGSILMQGYGRYRNYFADAIDKLKLDWNIFRVGTHKTFVEPFERMDMSDQDREATKHLIDQLWGSYRDEVAAARGLEVSAIDDYANNFLAAISDSQGDPASAALNAGLVDELKTRTEVRQRLIDEVGTDDSDEDEYNGIGMGEYLSTSKFLNGDRSSDENIGVIIASGTITGGSQPPGVIGAESTSDLLRQARNDDSVKAVVLRVDSGGGGVFASTVIAEEIAALQDSGKPVIASMSSVAASGGYWISVGADRVFANASTITGSIGIFGMFPTYQRTLAHIGIATDGVGSNPMTGELRSDRAMSDDARALLQLVIEDGYNDFIGRVATYRGMDLDAVDKVGQGRVWTGADALEFGLVDELGDLEEAIAYAAEIMDLEEGWGRKTIQLELSPTEQVIVDLLAVANSLGLDLTGMRRSPTTLERIAGQLESMIAPLSRFNDPQGAYAHCLCDFN